jgi:hypothetical protein
VNQNQDTYGAPWWEQELPAIRREQSVYLSRRLRALRADHDDLINEALWALAERLRDRSSAFPASWFRREPPEDERERSHLHKLAMVILKRRIADLFRKRAQHPIVFTLGEHRQDVADPHAPSPERRILFAKVLEITRSVLEEAKGEDRDLIALVSADTGLRARLDARERKRLQRIRERLRAEIARHLGDDLTTLLRINL